MSGGSFDYLCYKDAHDLIENYHEGSVINVMRVALAEYPNSESAITATDEVIHAIEGAHEQIRLARNLIDSMLTPSLRQVWRVVELNHSLDASTEDVAKQLELFHGP
jgi:hypothetical protein